MITFQQFLNQYNGQMNVGTTTENTGQCVGLIQKWLANILPTAPYTWGHAKDLITNCNKTSYEVVYNSATNFPVQGDVICWNSNMGGGYGHTAVVVKADVNTFEVFEQNNPTGSNCHLRTYPNYNNVIGWFRPKTVSPTPPTDEWKTKLQKYNGTFYKPEDVITFIEARKTEISNKDKVIGEKDKTINTLNSKLSQIKTIVG